MDFELNEQQRLLKDSLDRLMDRRYGFEQRAKYLREENGFSSTVWSQFAEMGLMALRFTEAEGGFEAGPEDTMLVMESLGNGLVVEPYLASAVACGALLRYAATPAQRELLAAGFIDGSQIYAWAHWEPGHRWERTQIGLRAVRQSDGWVLQGHKSLVLGGDSASRLLVTARVSGARDDEEGLSVFLVDANQEGVVRKAHALQDGTRAAIIEFAHVHVAAQHALGEPGKAAAALHAALDETIVATCAESIGVMSRMHALTVEYLKTRQQFGKTIGSFQALQHRAVEMLVHLEQARSITFHAMSALSGIDVLDRRRAIHAAKARVAEASRFIGQQAIQLHGAVGMTMEYAVSHYVRRATVLELLFGDRHFHQTALSRLGGLFPAQALDGEPA